jgi:hypothetical protein
MTTLADAGEVHPAALVTVKLYVPLAKPDMVVLKPVPAIDPGLIVQFPAGKPLNTTLPVVIAQVGCVIAPTTGAVGKSFTVIDPVAVATPQPPVSVTV